MRAARALTSSLLALSLCVAAQAALAQDLDEEPGTELIARPQSRSYFSLAFAGGMLVPEGDISDYYDPGLTAQLSLGFTTGIGLGVQATVAYSPLRGRPDAAASRESHLGCAILAPRYVLGDGTVRLWVAAGGGAVAMRERIEGDGLTPETKTEVEPVGAAAAGLELYAFKSGGIGVSGRYAHGFGQLAVRLYSVTGGLVLTFR